MLSGFKVLHGGTFTLVQDRGRIGFNDIGITHAGAMDEYAFLWANKLLNNDLNSACLEVLYSGLRLKATASCVIAVTGAHLELYINNTRVSSWQTLNIKKGDTLYFAKTIQGQRSYLAVKGGFCFQKVFGSCSMSMKEHLGVFDAKVIQAEDFLPFLSSRAMPIKKVKPTLIPTYDLTLTLRVVVGYQESQFSPAAKQRFFSTPYTITNESNRMGMKLKGEPIVCSTEGIISEGIAFGAIQIPKDGQPIILLNERQTIGGYPKLGSVLSIDCFKLAQMKVGSTVFFELIDIQKAQKKLRAFYSLFYK